MYTMSQVQICACTRIGIWQMYTIELLSEMVYKVYETVTLVETSVAVFLLYMDHKKLRWNPL